MARRSSSTQHRELSIFGIFWIRPSCYELQQTQKEKPASEKSQTNLAEQIAHSKQPLSIDQPYILLITVIYRSLLRRSCCWHFCVSLLLIITCFHNQTSSLLPSEDDFHVTVTTRCGSQRIRTFQTLKLKQSICAPRVRWIFGRRSSKRNKPQFPIEEVGTGSFNLLVTIETAFRHHACRRNLFKIPDWYL